MKTYTVQVQTNTDKFNLFIRANSESMALGLVMGSLAVQGIKIVSTKILNRT